MFMQNQKGGLLLGVIVGLVIGLAVAFAVAVYFNKNTLPIENKVQAPQPAQKQDETLKNLHWNPNESLQTSKPLAPSESAAEKAKETEAKAPSPADTPQPTVSAGPASVYWLQVGAFQNKADADGLRAKLVLLGVDTRIFETQQNDRTLYRVRSGPYSDKTSADAVKNKLTANQIDVTLLKLTP
jgi:cell division protein FtsN